MVLWYNHGEMREIVGMMVNDSKIRHVQTKKESRSLHEHEYIPKSGLRWCSCDTATGDREGSERFEMPVDLLPRV